MATNKRDDDMIVKPGRVIVIYVSFLLLSLVIIGRIIKIQFVEGDDLRNENKSVTYKYFPVEGDRGNIFDRNNKLLATSDFYYDLRFDAMSPDSSSYDLYLDDLCKAFENYYRSDYKSKRKSLKDTIQKYRALGNRYLLLRRDLSVDEANDVKKFPLFNLGKYKGGIILEQTTKRLYPYDNMAIGLIGYYTPERKELTRGIEGSFNNYLEGIDGKRLYRRIPGLKWRPVSEINDIDPKDGYDVQLTIDIDLQGVTESALKKQLEMSEADHGTAIVMEVSTGEILAIANIGRGKNGEYIETYNYAISERISPGSTFKLASYLAAFEDSDLKITDKYNIHGGVKKYANRVMKDSHLGGGVETVQELFQTSSNVGISTIITEIYGSNPRKFIDRLCSFGLNEKVNTELVGEASPYINSPKSKTWSKVSLPWMSIGYEVMITPLQMLNFYNTVANDGIMVKPHFVKKVAKHNEVVVDYKPQTVGKRIASKKAIEKVQYLLEKTVDEGTGSRLKNSIYRFAGKTGTAQITDDMKKGGPKRYNASFAGYFPAENPKYTVIVVISDPSKGSIYGGSVAAPVVRDIADRLYANSDEFAYTISDTAKSKIVNPLTVGNSSDIYNVSNFLQYNHKQAANNEWLAYKYDSTNKTTVKKVVDINNIDGKMPNLIGMSIKDASFICQKLNLKVNISGQGFVDKQEPAPGTDISNIKQVNLNLSVKNQKAIAQKL